MNGRGMWPGLVIVAALLVTGCGSSTEEASKALQSTASAPQASGDVGTSTTATAVITPAATPETATRTATPTATATPRPTQAAQQPITLVSKGFGQSRRSVVVGFVVENPNKGYSIESSQYQLAAYDTGGAVVKAESGYIDLLLPGQRLGFANALYLSEGTEVARIDVQIKPGRYKSAQEQPTFTVEGINYRPDRFLPRVTALVKSPYQKDTKFVLVNAIAYNDAGEIIGGGFTFLDFVPANGQAAVELSVTTRGDAAPARVEVYPALSSLSAFE